MKSTMNCKCMHNRMTDWHLAHSVPSSMAAERKDFLSPCRQNKRIWTFLHATRDKPDSLQRVHSIAAAVLMQYELYYNCVKKKYIFKLVTRKS